MGEFDGCETMPHAFFHPQPLCALSVFAMAKGFATLGSDFYTELRPTPLPSPHWVGTSHSVAQLLGLPEGGIKVKKPCRRSQATRCWQALPR